MTGTLRFSMGKVVESGPCMIIGIQIKHEMETGKE